MKKMIFTLMVAAITIHSFATENKKQFTLRIIADNAADDKAYINFDEGFNTAYVVDEDAQKVQGTSEGVPVVYTLSADYIPCAINNYGAFTQDENIPVGVNVDADGSYLFTLEDVGNFAPTSIIQLEDKATLSFTILNNASYTAAITASESETGRFFLHVLQPAQYSFINANCSNAAGKIEISYAPGITWSYVSLIDSNGALLQTLSNISGTFGFADLAGGSYAIQYTYGNEFTAIESIELGSAAVTADITNTTTAVGVDQEVQFLANTSNASNFTWTISDGTIITGIVNTYYTFYEKGSYSVIFSASNDMGCTSTDTAYFNVQEPTGISSVDKEQIAIWTSGSKKVSVTVPAAQVGNGTIKIYDLLGIEVYSQPITNYTAEISLSNVPNSYYIVSVGNSKDKRTQKVYLGNQ